MRITLLWFGITSGFSLLNKYMPGVLFLGLLLIIPFTRHKEVFTKKKFWLGMGAGFLIFLPNLIWQAKMGFPVMNHLSELNRTQLTNVNRFIFLAEQFYYGFLVFGAHGCRADIPLDG